MLIKVEVGFSARVLDLAENNKGEDELHALKQRLANFHHLLREEALHCPQNVNNIRYVLQSFEKEFITLIKDYEPIDEEG